MNGICRTFFLLFILGLSGTTLSWAGDGDERLVFASDLGSTLFYTSLGAGYGSFGADTPLPDTPSGRIGGAVSAGWSVGTVDQAGGDESGAAPGGGPGSLQVSLRSFISREFGKSGFSLSGGMVLSWMALGITGTGRGEAVETGETAPPPVYGLALGPELRIAWRTFLFDGPIGVEPFLAAGFLTGPRWKGETESAGADPAGGELAPWGFSAGLYGGVRLLFGL